MLLDRPVEVDVGGRVSPDKITRKKRQTNRLESFFQIPVRLSLPDQEVEPIIGIQIDVVVALLTSGPHLFDAVLESSSNCSVAVTAAIAQASGSSSRRTCVIWTKSCGRRSIT